MSQINRVDGGLIDRNTPLEFTFNGKSYGGYQGDTLASALLANGQRLMGRSFKYHRPRGPLSAGSEEPNALVELREGAHTEPNTRATVAELYQGLSARSQNHRGSLNFDFMAVNDMLSPFLAAGFYYKTFMWPKAFWEKVYEPIIRHAAGLGSLSKLPDPDHYDKGFLHCDVLVVGAGPTGLAAALSAGRAGLQVLLADEDFQLGGRLLAETYSVGGTSGAEWAETALAELAAMDNVRVMSRTTVYGSYDHGIYGALERVTDHLADGGGKPRQILWKVYSKRTVLAAGSLERPIAFGNNDRPGIIMAGSVRAYVNRWGASPGKRTAIFTNNDDGWRTATDLAAKGVEITAVIDSRDIAPLAAPAGASVVMGGRVVDTDGRLGLKSITLANGQKIEADCLAVSGGWSPTVHLTCHQRGRPAWRDDIAAFVPAGDIPAEMIVAGAANGDMTLHAALKGGHDAGNQIAKDFGKTPSKKRAPNAEDETFAVSAFWHV
ncbi:MAG: NADPH-dependent 2,4-dienoyl-CoA reductase/sulfur reductase-like enzyme, partial [Candidatus Paceibacteria bacterium]